MRADVMYTDIIGRYQSTNSTTRIRTGSRIAVAVVLQPSLHAINSVCGLTPFHRHRRMYTTFHDVNQTRHDSATALGLSGST